MTAQIYCKFHLDYQKLADDYFQHPFTRLAYGSKVFLNSTGDSARVEKWWPARAPKAADPDMDAVNGLLRPYDGIRL